MGAETGTGTAAAARRSGSRAWVGADRALPTAIRSECAPGALTSNVSPLMSQWTHESGLLRLRRCRGLLGSSGRASGKGERTGRAFADTCASRPTEALLVDRCRSFGLARSERFVTGRALRLSERGHLSWPRLRPFTASVAVDTRASSCRRGSSGAPPRTADGVPAGSMTTAPATPALSRLTPPPWSAAVVIPPLQALGRHGLRVPNDHWIPSTTKEQA